MELPDKNLLSKGIQINIIKTYNKMTIYDHNVFTMYLKWYTDMYEATKRNVNKTNKQTNKQIIIKKHEAILKLRTLKPVEYTSSK